MGKETIMLAKQYKSHKDLQFPVQITEKLDGVPVKLFGSSLGHVNAVSRQGEHVLSIEHIKRELHGFLPYGHNLIGELYIPGMDFKDISGLVRRKTSEGTHNLNLYIHDYYIDGLEHMSYQDRMLSMFEEVGKHIEEHMESVHMIPGAFITHTEQFDELTAKFFDEHPNAEGLMIRSLMGKGSHYAAGWRSPGLLKMKVTETLDVPVVSIEEAVDANKVPKGMVGRINVQYNGGISGVGPGKMSHKEREYYFRNPSQIVGHMIEITHMPDDSYVGIREGRYYRMRPDKDVT